MPSLIIRNLDSRTKERLRLRAARRQRSMEEEARHILREAVAADDAPARDLAETIRRRFAPLGGVEIALPRRESMRTPPRPAS